MYGECIFYSSTILYSLYRNSIICELDSMFQGYNYYSPSNLYTLYAKVFYSDSYKPGPSMGREDTVTCLMFKRIHNYIEGPLHLVTIHTF